MTVQSKGRQQQQQSPPPGRGHSQHLGLVDLMPFGLMIDSTDSEGLTKLIGIWMLFAGSHMVAPRSS